MFPGEIIRGKGASAPHVNVRISADTLAYTVEAASPHSTADEIVKALTEQTLSSAKDQALFPSSRASLPDMSSVWQPSWRFVEQYKHKERSFEVYWTKGTLGSCADYHTKAQVFALLLIDGASYIDMEDPQWEVLYVYERVNEQLCLVAFTTVYRFPVPLNGTIRDRLRVSQVVVLPPFQRQGHGGHMMRLIHKEADECNALEVTVEDPAPGMKALRDVSDAARYRDLANEKGWKVNEPNDDEAVTDIAETLRITKPQAQRCVDLVRWKGIKSLEGVEKEDAEKGFRLSIKRRLHKQNFSQSLPSDPEEKKRILQELYLALVTEYNAIVHKI